jgi:predicted phosphodiesterase
LPLGAATTLRYFHGSPRSYDEVIAAGTPPDAFAALLGGRQAAFLAGGHTHRQLVRRDGEALFINPGSVGLPGVGPNHPLLETNRRVAWAEYAVLESGDDRMRVELCRVPLDMERMFADARASGMPHLEWWCGLWASQ